MWIEKNWNSIKKIQLKAIEITIKYDKFKTRSANTVIKDKNSL